MIWIGLAILVSVFAGLDVLIGRIPRHGERAALGERLVAIAALLWGIATGFIFVPGGLLLAFALFDGPGGGLAGTALITICAVGIVTSAELCRAPWALLRGHDKAVRATARLTAWHHVGVATVFVALAIGTGHFEMIGFVLACCAIGEGLALTLVNIVNRKSALPAARAVCRKV